MHSPFKRSRLSRLEVEPTQGGVLARLTDCELLDEDSTPGIKDQLFRLAEGMGPSVMLLDLGEVRFVSSTALGMIVSLHKVLKSQGGRLTLCDVNEHLLELFEVTQLTRLLDIRQKNSPPTTE